MQIFFAGICGTFMAGLAVLAREMGMQVRGCDANVYPPMSEQLQRAGIEVLQGYEARHLDPRPDLVVIGNALSRGNPLVEYVLDRDLPYTSGPQWLGETVLRGRHVVAVSGTHGKTTTTSMLAHLLEHAGLAPGFLIGGVAAGFPVSARRGYGEHFVIEADEYDSAFFDKRSKFLHYRPRTLLINNIEFDHADIFDDLAAIERQFHHLVRTVPARGSIVHPAGDAVVTRVLERGCWARRAGFAVDTDDESGATVRVSLEEPGGRRLLLRAAGQCEPVAWTLTGRHNAANAAAAVAVALELGVPLAEACRALSSFAGVRRRMELRAELAGVAVYDDFAHHPTAIATTLEGLRAAGGAGRIIAVIEPRSNTMRLGVHEDQLARCVAAADRVLWFRPPGIDWDLAAAVAHSRAPASIHAGIEEIVRVLVEERRPGDRIVVMSNGSFGGIHARLIDALGAAA